MKLRDITIGIGGLSFIGLVISISLLIGNHLKPATCGCPKVISQNFILLFIILAVVFVGSLLYYLFSFRIELKNKVIGKNIEIFYSILDNEEKKVLEMLIKNKGKVAQSMIAHKFGKIKAHRILKKLKEKKIIEIKKEGKSNIIKLNKELLGELK